MNTRIVFFVVWFLSYSLSLYPQCQYSGLVMDEKTSEPLAGVAIAIDSGALTTTGMNGEYSIELPCQTTAFTFSLVGYEPISVTDVSGPLIIRLRPAATFLSPMIVSANRYEQDRSAAPIAISSITTAMLQETRPARLDEILNKVEGVYMVDLGSEQHTMAIRQPINYKGLFLYLEDGIPIRPTGVFNHNALLEMNMASLNRIEVIRGPASSLYGSEAIGGAINFISLRPSPVLSGQLTTQGSTNGYKRTDFNVSNTFGKLGLGLYGYFANRNNGLREHSDFDKLALTLKGNYILNDQNSLAFDITNIDYYADMTGSLDSTFFFGKDYTSQHTFTNRAVDALRAKINYQHFWNDESMTVLTAFTRRNSIRQNPAYRVQDDYSPWGNPQGDKNLAHGEINEDRVNSYGLIAQHNQSIAFLQGSKLSVGVNMDYSPDHFEARYIAIDKSDRNIYTGFTASDSSLTDYDALLFNIGVYAGWNVELTDRWMVSVGFRFDQLNFDFRNNLDENAFSGAPDEADNFSALTPKVGLTWKLEQGNGLYANYSQGFLPPQISELYRGVKIPVLQPSVYNNYEVGGYFHWNYRVSLDWSIYQMNGKNEIITVQLDNGTQENRNAGRTLHRGIEYGLKWNITDELKWRLSGTNAFHQFVEYEESAQDLSGQEMGQAPSWIANSELSYQPDWLENFRVSLEWQHVDPYFTDNANIRQYPGYDIFNARCGYSFKDFDLWVNVMNVANELYATVVRSTPWGDNYNAGEPRTLTLGVGYNFKNKNSQE